jgi:hypothetical protein
MVTPIDHLRDLATQNEGRERKISSVLMQLPAMSFLYFLIWLRRKIPKQKTETFKLHRSTNSLK